MRRKSAMFKRTAIAVCLILVATVFLSLLIPRQSVSELVTDFPHMERNVSINEYMHQLNLIGNKYTVVMPTYRRNDLLEVTLNFHCNCKHVDRIVVVWNNVHEEVPRYLVEYPCDKAEIIFLRQLMNSLNNRFKPFPQIRTEGVLVMDDDRLQTKEDIELGFETWKKNRDLLVGFEPYIHGYNKSSRLYYFEDRFGHRPSVKGNRTTYSIVLTTSFFVNVFYLKYYTTYVPARVKEFIDAKFNGEDIAMNFVVAQHIYDTQINEGQRNRSCLWVQGTTTHLEWSARRFRGINHVLKNFHQERNQLLNMLVNEYGRMALHKSDLVILNKNKNSAHKN